MGCNLKAALKSGNTQCKVTMAGTGDRVFFFDKDEWVRAIAADGNISDSTLPVPNEKGNYNDNVNQAKFAKLQGLLYPVDIKTDSGQVTSEKSAENEANSLVGTFVVSDNVDDFNILEHALRFRNFGCLIPRVGGDFYVIMSPYKKTTIESNYDSGTTYDSDHGFTVTVTASPAEYGVTTWKAPADLINWSDLSDEEADVTTVHVCSNNESMGTIHFTYNGSTYVDMMPVTDIPVGSTISITATPKTNCKFTHFIPSQSGATSPDASGIVSLTLTVPAEGIELKGFFAPK